MPVNQTMSELIAWQHPQSNTDQKSNYPPMGHMAWISLRRRAAGMGEADNEMRAYPASLLKQEKPGMSTYRAPVN